MKQKLTFIVLILSLFFNPLFSQDGAKLPMRVNVGTGFWSVSPIIMPVHAGMEFGLTEEISVGFDVEWRLYNDGWSHSVFAFQVRGDYYFNTLIGLDGIWDVYAGLQFGPSFFTATNDYPKTAKGFNFALDGLVGGRWYFSDNMALNAEVGLIGVFPDLVGPTAFMNFGITFVL